MGLTRIEYGSLASSEVINDNNNYLENKITELAGVVAANAATANSNIASVNNSIASAKNEVMDDVGTMFSTNGLYVDTYVNGTSWYREFFSDESRTTRVWIEQGGRCMTNSATTLLKEMSNTDYTLTLGRRGMYNEAEYQTTDRSTTGFYIRNNTGNRYYCDFYVCGQ